MKFNKNCIKNKKKRQNSSKRMAAKSLKKKKKKKKKSQLNVCLFIRKLKMFRNYKNGSKKYLMKRKILLLSGAAKVQLPNKVYLNF